MAIVNPGYRGIAYLQAITSYVRFADASITATQEINAPDIIMGDWDHDAYVYGPISVEGSISGPVTETFTGGITPCSGVEPVAADGIWHWGVRRNAPCGTLDPSVIDLYYYCLGSGGPGDTDGYEARRFQGVKVNSLNFSCAAGDVAQFSMDLMGTRAGAWNSSDGILPPLSAAIPEFYEKEKLITWDKVAVTIDSTGCGGAVEGAGGYAPGADSVDADVTALPVNFSNFEFTINNNLEAVYSLSQTDLFPVHVVDGLRGITGSLSVYNTPHADGVDTWDDYYADQVATITFNIGILSINMDVQFHRVQPASSVGNIISTLGFTGVGH